MNTMTAAPVVVLLPLDRLSFRVKLHYWLADYMGAIESRAFSLEGVLFKSDGSGWYHPASGAYQTIPKTIL
jgi:hypothetical protein